MSPLLTMLFYTSVSEKPSQVAYKHSLSSAKLFISSETNPSRLIFPPAYTVHKAT